MVKFKSKKINQEKSTKKDLHSNMVKFKLLQLFLYQFQSNQFTFQYG